MDSCDVPHEVALKETVISQKKEIEELLDFDLKTRDDPSLREEDFFPFYSSHRIESTKILLPHTIFYSFNSGKLMEDEAWVMKNFYRRFPFLSKSALEGLFVAGGYVSSMLFKEQIYGQDLDIFICGYKTIEEAESRIKKFIQHLLDSKIEIFSITRSKHAITIRNSSDIPIQIILRLYSSPSEVLHGFDLGSCMVGIWNERIYTTKLGQYSIVNRCNIINLPRRSTTYESRLLKYSLRGFAVVFPDLDVDKLPRSTDVNVSSIKIRKYNLPGKGDQIEMTHRHKKNRNISDYSVTGSKYIRKVNFELIAEWDGVDDLPALVRKKNFSCARCDPPKEVFSTSVEGIDEDLIIEGYENLRFYNKYQINVDKVEKFLPGTSLDLIYQRMKDGKGIEDIKQEYIKRNLDKVRLILAKNHIPVRWITENPGTQLCGSFNPTVVTKEEWYGQYYKE